MIQKAETNSLSEMNSQKGNTNSFLFNLILIPNMQEYTRCSI